MALSDTIWWTTRARIKAERRLLGNDFSSQIILLWYSAFTVCISIFELKSPSSNDYFAVTMVSLSVLILCASLFVANRNFKERAMLLKQCYEQLSKIEAKTKIDNANENELYDEYHSILSLSENHTEIDFKNAVVSEYVNNNNPLEKLTKIPTIYNIMVVYSYIGLKYFMLFILVLLPIFAVCFLRCF